MRHSLLRLVIALSLLLFLAPPAQAQVCGRVDGAAKPPTASDAFGALRASVGFPGACRRCFCDVNGDHAVTATDAFLILVKGVGLPANFACNDCSCGQLPTLLETGTHPRVVAVGDLNNDEIPDIISADDESFELSIFLGTGDGAFAAAVSIDPGGGPMSVTLAHLDDDENLDVVTTNLNPSAIAILKGRGDGSFEDAVFLTAPNSPVHAEVGDLNGDDRLDLVAVNSVGNDVCVYLATEEGGYVEQASILVGTGPRWVTLADVNDDEDLDAITTNRDGNGYSVALGNGDGTFGAAPNRPLCAGAHHVVAGHLDDDGDMDLVIPCKSDRTLAILFGKGDGSFEEAIVYPTGGYGLASALGDLDDDGDLDIVATRWSSHGVLIFENQGDRNFAVPVQRSTQTSPRGIVIAELTGDSSLDLLIANSASDNLLLFPGTGTTTFAGLRWSDIGLGNRARDMAVGDFNKDGREEIVVVNWYTGQSSFIVSPPTTPRAQTGLVPSVPPAASLSKNDDPIQFYSDVAVGDFNGDGSPDYVAKANKIPADTPGKRCTDPHLRVIYQRVSPGEGGFTDSERVAAGNLTHHTDDDFVVADFNGDEVDDIVLIERLSLEISYLRGSREHSFEVAQRLGDGRGISRITQGDVNGDGSPDIAYVVMSEPPMIVVRLHNQFGRFDSTPSATIALTAPPSWMVLADLNGDARADLVTGNQESTMVEIRLALESGTFAAATTSDLGIKVFEAPALVDLDADGLTDMIGLLADRPYDPMMPLGGSPFLAAGFIEGDGTSRGFRSATMIDPGDVPRHFRLVDTTSFVAANFDDNPLPDLVVSRNTDRRDPGLIYYNVGNCLPLTSAP
jgi:hypothetical protein